MDNHTTLTISEVRTLMKLVQKFQSLKTVKLILGNNPNRVKEFGFNEKNFENLELELSDANEEFYQWWKSISSKYHLPYESKFHVSYETCLLTITED